jgi:tetrapyrrole (corrin/porphyrin) methylase-like protein
VTGMPPRKRERGSLLVVGTGITGIGQLTLEAVGAIDQAERLFYLMNDPIAEAWFRQRHPSAQTLSDLYGEGKDRSVSYAEMAARVIRSVRSGYRVCVAVYGHPGVFVQFTHLAIAALRREGYPARMLPGVSADGCLIADLGFNPGDHGIQSFEATDFLMRRRRFDPTSSLVLWQVGVLGEPDAAVRRGRQPERLRRLVSVLLRQYPERHRVVEYLSNTFPGDRPRIRRMTLKGLAKARLSPNSTLLVPPLEQRAVAERIARWFDVGLVR